jgi:integrase
VDDVRRIFLDLDKYNRLLERLSADAYARPTRPSVLTLTLAATGRRIGEVLLLRARDVDFERSTATWRIEKKRRGDYYVTLPIPRRLADVLQKYVTWNAASDLLFPVSRTQAYYDVKKTLRQYGLVAWRPHDLRHAFILKALLETRSIELVRRYTQHASYSELLEYARIVGLELDKPPFEI